MNKIILGFVGPIASGKGTVCQYLKEKRKANIYRFSTILRDILNRIYVEQSRDNLQNLSLDLRKRFGDDILASTIAEDVGNDSSKIIAVDGVRRNPDIRYLKEMPNFYLVSINADQKTRYERIIKRSENSDDTEKTFEKFQQDEKEEAEQQIAEVAKTAKFKIDNNGSIDKLHEQIEDILKKINES